MMLESCGAIGLKVRLFRTAALISYNLYITQIISDSIFFLELTHKAPFAAQDYSHH